MLPDMLDSYLPTPEAKALLLALVKTHAQTVALHDGLDLMPLKNGTWARDIAAWLETVPTRGH